MGLRALLGQFGALGAGGEEPLDDDTISQLMAEGYQGGKQPPSQLSLQEDVIDVVVSKARLSRCTCAYLCVPLSLGLLA
jgi:hypothetical protein